MAEQPKSATRSGQAARKRSPAKRAAGKGSSKAGGGASGGKRTAARKPRAKSRATSEKKARPSTAKKATATQEPAAKREPAVDDFRRAFDRALGRSPAEQSRQQAERLISAPLPGAEEASGWEGLRVDGLGNSRLGRVVGVLVDAESGEPRWVVIRRGPLAGCTALPLEHVAEGAGRLWAAYERDWVRDGPRVGRDEVLDRDQELDLCAHWGIREHKGRGAEIAGRDRGAITAVPAGD